MAESANNEGPEQRAGRRQWLLTALLVAVVALASFSPVDRLAEREYENLFERALITFALARTLNGVISAVQGTELALQPAGVGVTLTPGEVLDPVNDLVERFSWIMLGATLSLGVQQVLLDIGQWWGTRVAVAVCSLLVLWAMWRRKPTAQRQRPELERYLVKALLLVLFLRFAVPLAMIANEAVYDLFLESRFTESTQVIESAGAEIQQASVSAEDVDEDDIGIFESLNRSFNSTRESMNFRERLAYISERASEVIEHLLQLGVVFIFQTGILPIAFLWLFLQLFRQLFKT